MEFNFNCDMPYINETKLYCVPHKYNVLLSCDLDTCNVEVLCEIEEDTNKNLYGMIIESDGCLYMIPAAADKIGVYNMFSKRVSYISLKEYDGYETSQKFICAVKFKKCLFLIPLSYPAIVCISLDSLQVMYIREPIKELSKNKYVNRRYFWKNISVIDNIILIPCRNLSAVLEFDMDSLKYRFHYLNIANSGLAGIAYDGENYWVVSADQMMVYKSPALMGSWKKIVQESEEITGTSVYDCFMKDKWLYIFPCRARNAYRIDITTDDVYILKELEKECADLIPFQRPCKVNFAKSYKDIIYVMSSKTSTLFEYSRTNKTVNKKKFQISEDMLKKIKPDRNIMVETQKVSLKEYLKTLRDNPYFPV